MKIINCLKKNKTKKVYTLTKHAWTPDKLNSIWDL